MKNLNYSLRYLLKNRGNSITRLISLTLGLIVSLLIFSYVGLNLSYNDFFPDKERVYQLWRKSPQHGMADMLHLPYAPNLAADIPQIEAATHYTDRLFQIKHHDNILEKRMLLTNSSFFDVLDFGIISGNVNDVLCLEGRAANKMFISERLAGELFGNNDPLGEAVVLDGVGECVVAGIFHTPPVNQSIGEFDMVAYMPYNHKDELWYGGDSYPTFIKLHKNASIAEVEAQMAAFIERHGLTEYLKEWSYSFQFVPISSTSYVGNDVQKMQLIYGVIGLITLIVACLNYVLLTISSLSKRSRTIAMLRCNGASRKDIFTMLLIETLLIILSAIVLAVFVIACLHQEIYDMMGYELTDMFAWGRIWIPTVVCIVAFLISGLLPAILFSVVKLQYAFRRGSDNRSWWKLILLFVQVLCSVGVVIFLLITIRQTNHILNADYGYNHHRLVTLNLPIKASSTNAVVAELEKLPCVESAGVSTSYPIWGYSGMPACDEESNILFSCRWDVIGDTYILAMQMQIVEGRNFLPTDAPDKVIVNQKYIERRGWSDSAIGRIIYDSAQEPYEIVGVVGDFKTLSTGVVEPIVMHPLSYFDYVNGWQFNIRLTEVNQENLQSIDKVISSHYQGEWQYELVMYSDRLTHAFADMPKMRNVMVAVSLITLFISLIGLVGYVSGEMQRRTKEIAIRKVCGATSKQVLALLGMNFSIVIIPAVVCGIIGARWGGESYLATLDAMRCDVPWLLYAVGALLVIIVIYLIIIIRTWRTANANPIDMIKVEN